MGLRHRDAAVEGVQFHPESVLTEWGHRMLANWLAECGDPGAVERSRGLAPVVGASRPCGEGREMTTLRPERPADDGPMSYEDTGQFELVVGRLSDPLSDPLPGHPPAVPGAATPAPRSRAVPTSVPAPSPTRHPQAAAPGRPASTG